MSNRRLLPGFTLVELLVVIGIIGLLISILLPALASARRAGQGVACLANFRNLANAEALYQAQSKGLYTIYDDDLLDLQKVSINEKNSYGRINYCPALAAFGIKDNLYASASQPGRFSSYTSYGWNYWFSFMRNGTNRLKIRPGMIKNSSELVARADVMPSDANGLTPLVSGGDNIVADPFRQTGTVAPMTAMKPNFHGRHNGLGAVLWMDGHASLERPVMVPVDAPVNAADPIGLQASPAMYRKNNLGYLAKPDTDFTSMQAEYYFVFRKDALSQNSMSIYLDPAKLLWH